LRGFDLDHLDLERIVSPMRDGSNAFHGLGVLQQAGARRAAVSVGFKADAARGLRPDVANSGIIISESLGGPLDDRPRAV
jgi:hypothetical protein